MIIYTNTIQHPKFGEVHIYWTEKRKIRQVRIGERPHIDIMAIPSDIKREMPAVYKYIMNYGQEEPEFGTEYLDFDGMTPFTIDIYETLFRVPRGTVLTYGELAAKAGYPRAARAVGNAMKKNNILLLLPCHRVVKTNSPGNFVSGLNVKKMLLENEGTFLKW